MKKLTIAFLLGLCPLFFFAQSADMAPGREGKTPAQAFVPNANKSLQGMWDLQFKYDMSASEQFALSNGIYVNGEFWAAEWNTDTLVRFDHDGNFIEWFTIAGLNSVRGMTWDGSSIWMANNSTTIYAVDPNTQQITSTINLNLSEGARFLSYDPTADNGNGGFWTGNFNTDIFLVSMIGGVLMSIPQSTHTLGGMYGAAIDNSSPGGPYLWVFHQAGPPNDALITQLQLPAGTPTGVAHNVEFDLGTSGYLAGGLFITDEWSGDGTLTLGGLAQGSPDYLFGYELAFQPGDPINVGSQEILGLASGCQLSDAEPVQVRISNDGPITASDLQLQLYLDDQLIAEETYPGPLMPGATYDYTFDATLDLSTPQVYQVSVFTSTEGDINNANDRAQKTVASKVYAYTPVSDNFDSYEVGDYLFADFYNIGKITFFANSGSTPSSNTGPSGDLNGDGNYIYMEASGFDAGDQAVLTSNCLDLTTVEDPQLIFYYHMYGSGIGYLSVDLTDESGATNNLFLQEGEAQSSSSDEWIPALIDLSPWSGQVVEITFTGEIGTGGSAFRCDIGLDEINITGCSIIDAGATVIPPSGGNAGSISLNPSGGTPPFTYQWSTGDTGPSISIPADGNYSVTITDANGCSTTVDFNVVKATEIEGLNRFDIFPNPVESEMRIDIEADLSGDARLELLDLTGKSLRLLWEGPIQSFPATTFELGNLPAGLYFISLSMENRDALNAGSPADRRLSTKRIIVR